MSDLVLYWLNEQASAELDRTAADLPLQEDALQTAVLISLFSDARAQGNEIDVGADQRGWWGASLVPGESELGSRLWTLSRAKATQDTLQRAQVLARESLRWLVEDGVVSALDVAASVPHDGALGLRVTLTLSDGQRQTLQYRLGPVLPGQGNVLEGSGAPIQCRCECSPGGGGTDPEPTPGALTLSPAEQQPGASASAAEFLVSRGAPYLDASVQYATQDGTALAGVDYQSISGPLDWAAGDDTPRPLSVPLISGGAGTFRLVLSDPQGATLQNATGEVTLRDVVGFESATVVPPPGASEVSLPVLRAGRGAEPVTLSWTTTPAGTTGTLSWPALDTSPRSISLDLAVEAAETETVTVTLNDLLGAHPGIMACTVTVADALVLSSTPYPMRLDDRMGGSATVLAAVLSTSSYTLGAEDVSVDADVQSGTLQQVYFPVDLTYTRSNGDLFEALTVGGDVTGGQLGSVGVRDLTYTRSNGTVFEAVDVAAEITAGLLQQVFFPLDYTNHPPESLDVSGDVTGGNLGAP